MRISAVYSQRVRELWEQPRWRWTASLGPAVQSWRGENPVCGDQVELLLCQNANGHLVLVHRSVGCPPVLAVAEYFCATYNSQTQGCEISDLLDWSSLEPIPPNKKHAIALGKQLLRQMEANPATRA